MATASTVQRWRVARRSVTLAGDLERATPLAPDEPVVAQCLAWGFPRLGAVHGAARLTLRRLVLAETRFLWRRITEVPLGSIESVRYVPGELGDRILVSGATAEDEIQIVFSRRTGDAAKHEDPEPFESWGWYQTLGTLVRERLEPDPTGEWQRPQPARGEWDDHGARHAEALGLLAASRSEDAIALLEPGLREGLAGPGIGVAYALATWNRGRAGAAMHLARWLRATWPEDAEALAVAAWLEAALLGRDAPAVAERGLARARRDRQAAIRAAIAAVDERDAAAIREAAADLAPWLPAEAEALRGHAAVVEHRWREAEAAYLEAAANDDGHAVARWNAAILLAARGRHREAHALVVEAQRRSLASVDYRGAAIIDMERQPLRRLGVGAALAALLVAVVPATSSMTGVIAILAGLALVAAVFLLRVVTRLSPDARRLYTQSWTRRTRLRWDVAAGAMIGVFAFVVIGLLFASAVTLEGGERLEAASVAFAAALLVTITWAIMREVRRGRWPGPLDLGVTIPPTTTPAVEPAPAPPDPG